MGPRSKHIAHVAITMPRIWILGASVKVIGKNDDRVISERTKQDDLIADRSSKRPHSGEGYPLYDLYSQYVAQILAA